MRVRRGDRGSIDFSDGRRRRRLVRDEAASKTINSNAGLIVRVIHVRVLASLSSAGDLCILTFNFQIRIDGCGGGAELMYRSNIFLDALSRAVIM